MLCLGITLNIKVINKKPPNAKNMALNRLWQGLCGLRAGAWKQCATLSASAGNTHARQLKLVTAVHTLVDDHEGTKTIDSGVTSEFQWVREFANIESMNNEDQLHGMRNQHLPWHFFFYKLLQGNQIAEEKKVFYITEFRVINAGGMTVTFVTIEVMYIGNSHQWLLKPLSARLVGNSPYYVWMWLSTQESTD